MKGKIKRLILLVFIPVCLYPQQKERVRTERIEIGKVKGGVYEYKWGESFESVKKKIKGTIKYEEENKLIISTDGDITYTYGFYQFSGYKYGMLYFLNVSFPLIEANDIIEKYKTRYGKPIKEEKNFILWEKDGTKVFLWLEEYENKSYTRKIDFISSDLSEKIKEDNLKKEFYQKRKESITDNI